MNCYEIEVAEGYRGQGVGRKLVEALKDLCISEGIMKMWVDTNLSNTAAVGLYRSTGARQVSPDPVQFGWVF